LVQLVCCISMQPCEDITYWAGYVTRYAVNHINPAATRAVASQVGRVRKTRANSSAVIWELGQTTAHESQRRRDDNWRCEVQAPSNKHVGSYRGSRDSDRSRDVVMCRRATQRRPPATRSVPVSQCPYSGELAKERSESMRGRGAEGLRTRRRSRKPRAEACLACGPQDPAAVVVSRFAWSVAGVRWPSGGLRGCTGEARARGHGAARALLLEACQFRKVESG
jgi:hypothetical protein